jgi:hypothetical protein
MKRPEFWVGQNIAGLGKIVRFHESAHEVRGSGRRLQSLFHYELVAAASVARRGSGVFLSLAVFPRLRGSTSSSFDVVELTHDGLGFSADIQSLLTRGVQHRSV